MEFTVEFLDYGRHGVVAKEPRTGLCVEGRNKEEVREDMGLLLKEYVRDNYVPPAEGPVRSFVTIEV